MHVCVYGGGGWGREGKGPSQVNECAIIMQRSIARKKCVCGWGRHGFPAPPVSTAYDMYYSHLALSLG